MTSDDTRARYLATGPEDGSPGDERLDLIRDVLTGDATWTEPPPQVLDGVLATVAGPTRQTPAARPRWPVVTAAIGSAVAVVALVVSTMAVLDAEVDDTILAMVGTEIEAGAGGTAAVRPTGSGWWIRLDLTGLPPAPEGSYYEGWVWSDDGEGVSIGTFHLKNDEGPVILWSGVEMEEYPSIWVTLEDEEGSAEASDRVVMKGRMPDQGGA
jgi:hypothetical protein